VALSPAATEIEAQTIRWIADLVGYRGTEADLVSGGNMANMVGFLAARPRARPLERARERRGRERVAPDRLRLEGDAHLGAEGRGSLRPGHRRHPLDRDRCEAGDGPDALSEAIENDLFSGRVPLLVVGTAGSVSTGAIDPLREIAAVCRRHGGVAPRGRRVRGRSPRRCRKRPTT
jgi:glutamate/tyrosine decarboxylase-like PLP-dependent enzyme